MASTARAIAGSSRPTAAATLRSSRFINRTISAAVMRSRFFDAAFLFSVSRCSASRRAARRYFLGWEVIPALYRSCKKSRGTANPGCAVLSTAIPSRPRSLTRESAMLESGQLSHPSNEIGWVFMSLDVLKKLFEQHFHATPEHVQPLQGELGGSGRKIIRLSNSKDRAIGILYGVREENAAFLAFSKHFRRHGLPVPQIYAEDLAHGAYLEEDTGDTTLFEFLSKNRVGENIAPQAVEAYRKVVGVLPRFQIEAGHDLNYEVCYPRASFDRQSIAWDLNYFKYYFLR